MAESYTMSEASRFGRLFGLSCGPSNGGKPKKGDPSGEASVLPTNQKLRNKELVSPAIPSPHRLLTLNECVASPRRVTQRTDGVLRASIL